jgi:Asp/Glu/hydantoin racemase
MPRIACLHTVESNRAVFEAAERELGRGDVTVTHAVRADLLGDAEKAGGLTTEIKARAQDVLLSLAQNADAVVLTCSTVGPSVAGLAARAGKPVLRVDEALAREAVKAGGRVVVLCAVETTVEPTRRLFDEAARGTAATVEMRLVPGAWAAFKSGDVAGYHRRVADAAEAALGEGASCVALAQASMAGAAKLCGPGAKVLASPAAGLAAAADAVRRSER